MKNALRSFFSFNRTERMGIIGLLVAILVLIVIKFSMSHFVSAETIVPAENNSGTKCNSLKALNNNGLQKSGTKKEQNTPIAPITNGNKISKTDHAQVFNINTVDSQHLVSLWGIGPKLAHRILDYRRQHGSFTSHEQLLEVYRFSDTVYSILKARLVLDDDK